MAATTIMFRRLVCSPSLSQRIVTVLPCSSSIKISSYRRNSQHSSLVSTSLPDIDSEIERVSKHSLRGKAMRAMQQKLRRREPLPPPRELRMKDDQEWSNVYPTAAPFKWSAVPLPIRMGYPVRRGIPPHKYGNAELLKIPNFLHLTPPAVKKHCAALREFCTDWPEGLDTDKDCERHFPLEIETSDFVFSGASLRHPDARIVKLKVKLRDLPLDKHSRWKLIQLAGKRYNEKSQTLTLTVDRCPVRKQNYDYATYLLTVLFHEAWVNQLVVCPHMGYIRSSRKNLTRVAHFYLEKQITEPWEADITEEDMEEYVWDISSSRRSAITTLARMKTKTNMEGDLSPGEELEHLLSSEVRQYREAVTALRNNEEGLDSLEQYKAAALDLLQMGKGEDVQDS